MPGGPRGFLELPQCCPWSLALPPQAPQLRAMAGRKTQVVGRAVVAGGSTKGACMGSRGPSGRRCKAPRQQVMCIEQAVTKLQWMEFVFDIPPQILLLSCLPHPSNSLITQNPALPSLKYITRQKRCILLTKVSSLQAPGALPGNQKAERNNLENMNDFIIQKGYLH